MPVEGEVGRDKMTHIAHKIRRENESKTRRERSRSWVQASPSCKSVSISVFREHDDDASATAAAAAVALIFIGDSTLATLLRRLSTRFLLHSSRTLHPLSLSLAHTLRIHSRRCNGMHVKVASQLRDLA